MADAEWGSFRYLDAGADPRIAKILLAESLADSLSAEVVRDATQHRFSYRESALRVIDWNDAVVVEPTSRGSGSSGGC